MNNKIDIEKEIKILERHLEQQDRFRREKYV